MNPKTYKARVQISLIVEIDVEAVSIKSAGATAESIGDDLAKEFVSSIESSDTGDYAVSWSVACTDVSKADYA